MFRVAVYLRVSTDEQAAAGTIEIQAVACREYCGRNGLEIVDEYRDDGISGTVPFAERPGAARLLEDAKAGRFDSVLVYAIDRLSRDNLEGLVARKQLKRLGISVHAVTQSWNDDTDDGELLVQMLLGIAEFEKKQILKRTMAGRLRRVSNGHYQASHVPFGYDKADGVLVPSSKTAPTVQQVFDWALEGTGTKVIADRLNAMGIPPPSAAHADQHSSWGWHFSSVYKILTAPRYIGKATYGRKQRKGAVVSEGLPMQCPPIIGEEVFAAVQQGLHQRKRDSSRNTGHVYLLQHLVHCRHCGGRYRVKSSGKQRSYECSKRAVHGPKAGHEGVKWHWRADEIESIVKNVISDFESNPGQFAEVIEIYRERLGAKSKDHRAEIARLSRRLDDLTDHEQQAVRLAVERRISDLHLSEQLDRIKSERAELQNRRDALQGEDALQGTEIEDVLAALRKGRTWGRITALSPKRDEAQWSADIHAMIRELWVEPDGSLTAVGRLGDFLDFDPGREQCVFSSSR